MPAEPAEDVPASAEHPLPAGSVPATAARRRRRNRGGVQSDSVRRSSRIRKTTVQFGMVAPGDIGQAVLAQVCAAENEATGGDSVPSLPSDPRTYAEAMKSKDAAGWRESFRREEDALIEKGVFTVVDSLPPDARCVGAKIVFRTKTDGDGRPLAKNALKTSLTAMGNQQKAGVDYGETFSSAMSLTSLRLLVRLAAHKAMRIGHIDVSTAYLNADLDRPIYMRAPPGMHSARPGQFLLLKKALYGLHQSGRLWAELLISVLISLGFFACENGDPYVLVRLSRTGRMLATTAVIRSPPVQGTRMST